MHDGRRNAIISAGLATAGIAAAGLVPIDLGPNIRHDQRPTG